MHFIVSHLILSYLIYLVFDFDSCLIICRIVFNLSYYLCIFIFFLLSLLFYFTFGPFSSLAQCLLLKPISAQTGRPNSRTPNKPNSRPNRGPTATASLLSRAPSTLRPTKLLPRVAVFFLPQTGSRKLLCTK